MEFCRRCIFHNNMLVTKLYNLCTFLQVPAGSLPRTMEVILRNDQVESVRPGDKACFTGCLIVIPDVAALT